MALWSALISRPSRTPLALRPSLTLFFLLVGAFFLTFVPHVEQLPIWVSVSVLLALIIRCVLEYHRLPLPSPLFCSLLALCLLVAIFLQFSTLFGREAGTAFMAGLLAVKFFELRGPRDIAVIIFASFFVVMSTLLYSQALELFIYCLIMMWILTALLMRVQIGDRAEDHLLQMLGRSGLVFLQALPLTIVLFLFFPRFNGKLQVNLNESPLGLNDTVSPGDIAQLAKDDRSAFYVKFDDGVGDLPIPDLMYWRGLVLWDYHEGTWTVGRLAEVPSEPPTAAAHRTALNQTIVIYPHFRRWLFALDYPVGKPINKAEDKAEGPGWATVYEGNVLQVADMRDHIDRNEQYTVTSAFEIAPQRPLNSGEEEAALQLVKDQIDPDVVKLADQLWQQKPEVRAYVSAVRSYFRTNKFVYSAAPGRMRKGEKWLHEFMFEKKTGFCEHFASAFAIMMRLEHVPARLVVGYRGAQFNPYSSDYIVKQSYAHAWDEVWLADKRTWLRVDPTGAAAPGEGPQDQVAGSSSGSQDEDGLSIQVANTRLTLLSGSHLPDWMRRSMLELQLRRQQIEANWDDIVFSYDPEAQNRLAQALGFGKDPRFMLVLACLLAIGICVSVFRRWMQMRPAISPVETLYALFCRNMAQRGIPRAEWEGPLAYTERAAEAFPEKREAIRGVGWIVAHARYGPRPAEPSAPANLKELVGNLFKNGPASAAMKAHEPA